MHDWVHGQTSGWMDGRMIGRIGWMHDWVHGQMSGWMDGEMMHR